MRYSTYKKEPDTLEPHEEKVWEGLKWCAIWAIAVFIICCLLAVVKIS